MRILFFGTPDFAVPTLRALLASSHEVVGVVTQPDRPKGRGQKIAPGAVAQVALDAALPLVQPVKLSDPGVREALAAFVKSEDIALTVVGTFISDLVLMWIDPRIRHQVDQG